MEFRKQTENKKLSFIGLGCWRFGEPETQEKTDNPGKSYWGSQDRKDSLKTIDAALRGGITHFDTAQSYGYGRSEQITGQRLRRVRESCIIATKLMINRSDPDDIEKKVNLSLKRLNSDYIDIFYLHWPSDTEQIKKAVNILQRIRESGKIRHIGVSNFSVSEMKTAMKEGQIDFHQTGYSLLWRESEKEIIPFCIENKISVIAYSFFAQGLLTASDLNMVGQKTNDRRRNLLFFKYKNEDILHKFRRTLFKISTDSGYSVPQLLISWAKSRKWLDSVLIGASNRKQIEDILKSEKTAVEEQIIEKLEELSSETAFDFKDSGNIFGHTT